MEVTIHGEKKFIPVTTVTLQSVPDGSTYPFHCRDCGNTLNVIGGQVTKIYPILEPSDQIPVIQTCKSCKSKYIFQETRTHVKVTAIKVLLKPTAAYQAFYCYLGGGESKYLNKIIDYKIGEIMSPLMHKKYSAPFLATCGNKECNLTYEFTQLS